MCYLKLWESSDLQVVNHTREIVGFEKLNHCCVWAGAGGTWVPTSLSVCDCVHERCLFTDIYDNLFINKLSYHAINIFLIS